MVYSVVSDAGMGNSLPVYSLVSAADMGNSLPGIMPCFTKIPSNKALCVLLNVELLFGIGLGSCLVCYVTELHFQF